MAVAAACGLGAMGWGCIERPASQLEKRASFDRANLAGTVLLTGVPSVGNRIGAVFGGTAELIGVDINPPRAKPGDAVEVVFVLRVLDEADEDYKVFVHIDDVQGRGDRINRDHWPADGKYMTSVWRKGEVVRDRWFFRVPGYMQGHQLEIWSGFYLPSKTDRWPLSNPGEVRNDGNNRIWVGSVPVD